nr:glycosyltransferase family 4 protein [uncultured Carboxylicivirga sp.]
MQKEANQKPSVCIVIPRYVTFSTGGAEIQVYYLVNELLQRGWNVEIVCAAKGLEEQVKKSDYYDERISFYYYRKQTIRSFEFFSVFFLLFKTKSRAYYQRTDFALTAACALFCKLKRRKMLYVLAQDKDAERKKYRKLFRSFTYQSKTKKMIRKIDFFLIDKMVEWGKRNARLVIAQNKLQKETFKRSFRKKPIVIPSSFPPIENLEDNKENIVLWVGNMTPDKRPELFIEMVRNLKQREGWRFVMIGKPNKEIEEYKGDEVEILGELSYHDTLEWFIKSTVYVNTSSREGMPNTFIQAWFTKVLVLSLAVDPDKMLSELQRGNVFNDNVKAMSAFVDRIISGEEGFNLKLENAIMRASREFDLKKNVDKLTALFKVR